MRRFEGARCEGSRVRGCGAKVLRCENWRVQRVSILKHCEQCIRSGTAGQPTILDAVVDDAVLVCGPRQHNHSGGTHVAPPWRETLGVDDDDLPHGPALDLGDMALHRQGEPPLAKNSGKLLAT